MQKLEMGGCMKLGRSLPQLVEAVTDLHARGVGPRSAKTSTTRHQAGF